MKIAFYILLVVIAPVLLLALRFILVGKSTSQALDAFKKNLQKKDPDSQAIKKDKEE